MVHEMKLKFYNDKSRKWQNSLFSGSDNEQLIWFRENSMTALQVQFQECVKSNLFRSLNIPYLRTFNVNVGYCTCVTHVRSFSSIVCISIVTKDYKCVLFGIERAANKRL